MRDDLSKAESRWRSRSLFRPQARRRTWRRWVLFLLLLLVMLLAVQEVNVLDFAEGLWVDFGGS